jgi:peptide/nickel transport system permease protein
MSNALQFDYGMSIVDGKKVSEKISTAFQWSMLLLLLHFLTTTLCSLISGVYSGLHPNGKWDRYSSVFWLIMYSIPTFWLASMLIIYCTSDRYGFSIFPPPGLWLYGTDMSPFRQLMSSPSAWILPVICLAINDIAYYATVVKHNIIHQSQQYYATMAKARGIDDPTIARRYLLPNSLLSLITTWVTLIPAGLSGSLIIEVIFNIPGVGRLIYNSIQHSDWNTLYAAVLIIAAVTIVLLIVVDVLYRYLQPKWTVDVA